MFYNVTNTDNYILSPKTQHDYECMYFHVKTQQCSNHQFHIIQFTPSYNIFTKFTNCIIKYLHPYDRQRVIIKIIINIYHHKDTLSFHITQFTNHYNQYIIHQSNIDSFVFYHIIMNTRYKIIKAHFDKVCLLSQNCFFSISKTK